MPYHYEATKDFFANLGDIDEIKSVLHAQSEKLTSILLKMSVVSIVTKFQVFVQSILKEFKYRLQHEDVHGNDLCDYIKMNSVYLRIAADDDDLKKLRIRKSGFNELFPATVNELKSFTYLYSNSLIDDSFCFNTKFPLGKTGTDELHALLKQLDGDDDPFSHNFDGLQMDKNAVDSMLGIRHAVVHKDKFNGTENTIDVMLETCRTAGAYIDEYIYRKSSSYLNYD